MTEKLPTPAQWRIIWLTLIVLSVAVLLALIGAVVWGAGQLVDLLSPVLWPLAVAAVLACLLSPLVAWLEKRGVKRPRAILLVFVAGFAICAGMLASVIPQVVSESQDLIRKIPDYSLRLQHWAANLMAHPPEFLRRFLPAQPGAAIPAAGAAANPQDKAVDSAVSLVTQHWSGVGSWLFRQKDKVAALFGVIAGLALIPVYTYYFLIEQSRIEHRWQEYLPVKNAAVKKEVVFVLEAVNRYLIAFFRGQVLVAICDSVLYTIAFLVTGLNYAFLVGFAALFLTMIPFLGAIILCVVSLLLAFAQFGDWQHPAIVLGIFVVVQTLEGFVISPKIIGDRVGLHPMMIIIAVMVGTTLMGGILGGILAIPLAAALRVILFRYVWKARED